MAVLYHPSLDPSRVYYGTDTRALELLVGAALAMVWPSRRLTGKVTPQARRMIDGAGLAGLIVIGLMFWRSNEFSPFLYRGGFAVLALGTALVGCRLRPSRLAPRPDRRLQADAVDRRTLLRDLPLDPADHRPHLAAGRARPQPAAGDPAGGGDHGGRRALLALPREPDPPRRAGQALEALESR